MPRLARVLVLCALVWAAMCAVASASGGRADYRIEDVQVAPALRGASVEVLGGDDRIELHWPGREALVVVGYAGEPYLRLSPEGAFENANSPTVDANRDRFGASARPADPDAPPAWRRISTSPEATWHDHRAHWMSRTPPAAVRDDPDRRQVVQRWTIPVTVGGSPASIAGRLDYLPPPSRWPWVAGILAAAVAIGLLVRRGAGAASLARAGALVAVAAGAVLVTADLVATPLDGLTSGMASGTAVWAAPALWLAALIAAVLAWRLARRHGPAAEALVLTAGAWLLGGVALLGSLGDFGHAVLTPIPGDPARAILAAGLAGMVAPAVWAWRQTGLVRGRARAARAPQGHDRALR